MLTSRQHVLELLPVLAMNSRILCSSCGLVNDNYNDADDDTTVVKQLESLTIAATGICTERYLESQTADLHRYTVTLNVLLTLLTAYCNPPC